MPDHQEDFHKATSRFLVDMALVNIIVTILPLPDPSFI